MSEGNLRSIVEASMGKKSDEEWKDGMRLVKKVLDHDLGQGKLHSQHSLIELARHLFKKPDRRCLN